VRYYVEQRDAEFGQKMAKVLCVYREVQVLKKITKSRKSDESVAIVSYESRPSQRRRRTRPPVPGVHATFARDHEYKRHGPLSLLAGIDLLTGKVHALVRDRHRSREFIEILKLLDARYARQTALKVILDNHSAHILRETRTWLAAQPPGRFDFTFTPKHGSWLNLIEGFFSRFARSVLRHIRVSSKYELKQRKSAATVDGRVRSSPTRARASQAVLIETNVFARSPGTWAELRLEGRRTSPGEFAHEAIHN
jgi:transposase